MNVAEIPNATRGLGAPADWTPDIQGTCGVLPILDHTDEAGANVMSSHWEPTPEELAALAAGGRLQLSIYGTTHPVVSLGVTVPPDAIGPHALTRAQYAAAGTAVCALQARGIGHHDQIVDAVWAAIIGASGE